MSDFQASAAEPVLDPYQRVKYAPGLVLGPEEFDQEELYLLEKHRLHHRGLHGYGTVCGLRVRQRGSVNKPEILVEPGIAVDPRGREIRVPLAQCADLDDWLARHRDQVRANLGSPPHAQSVFVVLCYRECATRTVPIPAGPCRSLEESAVASRVADDFELRLQTAPPEQTEDDRIRELGELLRGIEIADGAGPFHSAEDVADQVRALAEPGSPPTAAPPLGSPPGSLLRIDRAEADEVFRAAFRVWVTEVRPKILPEGRNCASGPPLEGCVLLAELLFEVDDGGSVPRVGGPVLIDDQRRPYLVQTRLLQEWLLTRMSALVGHSGVEIHGDLAGLGDDDHPQYLRTDGTRALTGDLSAGSHRIADLADFTDGRDAVPAQQIVKRGDSATNTNSDLIGTYPFPRVAKLRGRPVANTAPSNAQVLTWTGNRWEPADAPAPGVRKHGDLDGLLEDDHPQYLRTDGTRALTGDLSAGSHRIADLADFTDGRDAVPAQQIVKRGDSATNTNSDLIGTYPFPRVAKLRGRPVANTAPSNAQVLTWTGNRWEPADIPAAPTTPGNFEENLVRITTLSWTHGLDSEFKLTLQSQGEVRGVVIGFGFKTLADDPGALVKVERGSLDEGSFQLFLELEVLAAPVLREVVRVIPEGILPVKPITPDLISVAEALSPAPAAVLLITPAELDAVRDRIRRALIVVRGDFVRDVRDRAVDAEHLRGQLPTGDRPLNSELGLTGGTFVSWVTPRFDG